MKIVYYVINFVMLCVLESNNLKTKTRLIAIDWIFGVCVLS